MNKETLDLITASDHPYNCICEQCKSWWVQVGPDEDGDYGPFSSEEVHGEPPALTAMRKGARDPYDEPSVPCPYCSTQCSADFVDVGIGMVQCGPYHCHECGASEMGPEGDEGRSEIEKKTGWYQGGKVSPYANTVNGEIVDHKSAATAHRLGLLDAKVPD